MLFNTLLQSWRNVVITCCSISSGIPTLQFEHTVLQVCNTGKTCFIYLAFHTAPKEVSGTTTASKQVGHMHQIAPQVTPIGNWSFETSLLSDQCFCISCYHAQWCSKQLLTQHRLLCKISGQFFLADSLLISQASPGPPALLILQDQNTPLGLCQKYGIKNVSCQYWWLKNSKFKCVFKGYQRKCHMLFHTFQHDCRSAINNTVFTYKVSYSNTYN